MTSTTTRTPVTNDTPYSYSYCPENLIQSYQSLKKQEENDTGHNHQDFVESGKQESSSSCSSTLGRNNNNNNNNNNVVRVASIQLTSTGLPNNDIEGFYKLAQTAVIDAATKNHSAQIILLPELFIGPYFCQSQEACLLSFADPVDENHFLLRKMKQLAKQYRIVLPISIYERKNNALYNSVTVIDADGSILGTYRKSHIPDGTGYQEKFYFTPGDTGFKVWSTKYANIGVGICWDQWFPEAARAMVLQGADILFYPTAIGSEPQDPTINSVNHWQRVMQGHAASNMVPIVASNRYGTEILLHSDGITEKQRIHFYGKSFITSETGEIMQEAKDNYEYKQTDKTINNESTTINDDEDDNNSNNNNNNEDDKNELLKSSSSYEIIVADIDILQNQSTRLAWGLFRDRRPELYTILQSKDGHTNIV